MTTIPNTPDDFTDLLYKYTDFNGAQKTLSTGKLRFTRPSEMNDPFDVRIDQWMAMEYKPFYELIAPRLIERQLSGLDGYAELAGMGLQDAKAHIDEFQSKPENERMATIEKMTKFAVSRFGSYLPELRRSTDEIRGMPHRSTATVSFVPPGRSAIFSCGLITPTSIGVRCWDFRRIWKRTRCYV
jgi:hypothetical protein